MIHNLTIAQGVQIPEIQLDIVIRSTNKFGKTNVYLCTIIRRYLGMLSFVKSY